MKKIITFLFFSNLLFTVDAQVIKFNLLYSNSTLTQFNKSLGLETGYSKVLNSGNKIEFVFSCINNPFDYDLIRTDPGDINNLVFKQIEANSFAFSIQNNFLFQVISKENAKVYFGPTISLNSFLINESIYRLSFNPQYADALYTNKSQTGVKLACGILLEYCIQSVLFENLDLISAFASKIGTYEDMFATGSPDPWLYLSFDVKLGLNYRFGSRQK